MNINYSALIIFIGVSIGAFGLLHYLYTEYLERRLRIHARFRNELEGLGGSSLSPSSPLFRNLQDSANGSLWRKLKTWLDQSGLKCTPSQFVTLSLGGAAAAAMVAFTMTHSPIFTVLASGAALLAPFCVALTARTRRLWKLSNQLPDAFDVMSRALRAGQAVPAAFQLVGRDFDGPIAEEFAYCYERQHLGVSQEAALRDLARRNCVMELRIFVVAMIVSGRSGGNLAELLSKLAALLRKRLHMQGRIRAMTSEGRFQAAALTALPTLVFIAMYVLNRPYAEQLLERPWLLIGCILSQILGALCIRWITRIDL